MKILRVILFSFALFAIATFLYGQASVVSTGPGGFESYNITGANYERAFMKWDSNVFKIGTEKSGSGTLRNLSIEAPTIVLGSSNVTMTGSIADTTNRVTKGWFTNLEVTNSPTVNGTAISAIYAPIASPTFTGIVTTPIMIFNQQVAPAAAADVAKVWAQDYAAGDSRLYFQSESGNPIIIGNNEIQLYNTADITINYERVFFRWASDAVRLGVEKGGGGTARTFRIDGPGTSQFINMALTNTISVGTGGKYIDFDGNTGILYPTGALDLGYPGNYWKGLYIGYGANGQGVKVEPLTELTTIAAAAYTDTTIQIPANSIVIGVSGRVTVQPGGTTTVDCGVSGFTARYADDISTVAGQTWTGIIDGTRAYTTAVSVRLTPDTTPSDTAGRVRVTIHYITITPPTS